LIEEMSGGNQQKTLISRWLLKEPKIIIFDEPTRGIDVGAKYEIYRLIRTLAQSGKGIIMISSELPEIIGLSDRIMVMRRGRIEDIIDQHEKESSEEEVMSIAVGHTYKL
ncbi:MAG TPA: sugar ABC transporter ATP-binding protein, partial [Spirochaetes bacterium]|nr:sugar ABC transporter ATP-binding protein [Spirochaetota bacterium]